MTKHWTTRRTPLPETAITIPVRFAHSGAPLGRPPLLPLTFGVPLPEGVLREPYAAALIAPASQRVSVQGETTAVWRDGSCRWILIDAAVPHFLLAALDSPGWQLQLVNLPPEGGRAHRREIENGVALATDVAGGQVAVTTGRFQITLAASQNSDLSIGVRRNRHSDPTVAQVNLSLMDARRRVRAIEVEHVGVETAGPVRATLNIAGRVRGTRGIRARVRLSCFANALLCLDVALHNSRRARHRGGLWDLGDPGSFLFREFGLQVATSERLDHLFWRTTPQGETHHLNAPQQWRLYQDSSGGPHWQHPNQVNRYGQVPCRRPGYALTFSDSKEEQTDSGLRASPLVAVAAGGITVAGCVPRFWQQFPKGLSISDKRLHVGLFPGEWGDLHELQGGEKKVHRVWLSLSDSVEASAGLDSLTWTHAPPRAVLLPEWYTRCGMAGEVYLAPHARHAVQLCDDASTPMAAGREPSSEQVRRYTGFIHRAVFSDEGIVARLDEADEFGWRNDGDVHADHEARYYEGSSPLVSHYNNQFDLLLGLLMQWMHSGDTGWAELADPLARHISDIDIYQTTTDRASFNGGLFWMTDHYLSAQTATHRAFSRQNATRPGYGGGPSNEHNYATGLLYHYYVTGEPTSREAVMTLADWVCRMDDGRQTPLFPVDDGPTGLATATSEPDYHGPGRGAANSINTLVDAWLLSGHSQYIDKAEELIRRTIHPRDDIGRRNLLDAERRWSYTMYLNNLARYLYWKARLATEDMMWSYARAALLHYARWMLERERPYLDRPDELAYPTEAWAAQEFRKANCLRAASVYAGADLSTKLRSRAEQLADRAWSDLLAFKTACNTRTTAIVLIEGLRDLYWRTAPPGDRNALAQTDRVDAANWPPPVDFLPQRARAKQAIRDPRFWPRIALRMLSARDCLRVLQLLWRWRN